ncbi:MAG: hypothetical protein ACI9S8_000899 [Chlamydiales bacterium]|jgi:hypothetical protein
MREAYSNRNEYDKIQMPLKALSKIRAGDKIAIYNDFHIDLYVGRNHGLSHESEVDFAHAPNNARTLENLQALFKGVKMVFEEEDKSIYEEFSPFIEKAVDGLETLLKTYESLPRERSKVHFIKNAIKIGKSL